MQQHWARVYAIVYRLVVDPHEAEDLALEVFWELQQRRPAFKDEDSLRGWLYRVATNLGLNTLRASQRRQRYERAAGEQALLSQPPGDPAHLLEQAQERQLARQALAQLKTRSAQLLLLRYSGLSYAETAAALGLAPASIGTLLARAEAEFAVQMQRLDGWQE